MKNKILVFIIISLASNNLLSQSFPKNAVYYDFMGHTRSTYSLNYERYLFKIYKDLHLNARTGIGHYKYYNYENYVTANAVIIPTAAVLEYGKQNHFFNISGGYSASFIKMKPESKLPRFDSAYSLSIGYKYITDTGWFFQIYSGIIQPKISPKESTLGLSIGGVW
ncbi:hypothetical protein [Flavobacterium sp.]|uniref:hypothetical protein n=1 Tax=Flavobacterium sp. TaxID=239 RepID=UPI004048A73A